MGFGRARESKGKATRTAKPPQAREEGDPPSQGLEGGESHHHRTV